jgi:hypothetical protein
MVSAFTMSTMGEEIFYGRDSKSFNNEAEEDDVELVPPPRNESMSVTNSTNGYNKETETQPVMYDNDMTTMNNTNENNMSNNTNDTTMLLNETTAHHTRPQPCMDLFGDVNGGSPWNYNWGC